MATSHEPRPLTRRELRRRAQRRRRSRAALTAALVTVGLVAGALLATDTLRIPTGQGPVLADGGARAEAASGLAVDPDRPLTPDDPLRLWIAGDSLAGSLGPSLGAMTAESGVVQPTFDSRVSSGLESPTFFDWPEHAADELARLDPEAVAFVIGTNDAKLFAERDEWRDDYAETVGTMMDLLVGNGRDVYWVAAPTMADSDEDALVRQVNAVFSAMAAQRPGVTYVDSYALFAGSDGRYAPWLADEDGDLVTVRADDGVHLTPEGGDRMAEAVFEPLDATWHITDQAVPGEAKEVVQTPGSSQITGTYRPPQPSAATTTTTAPPPSEPPPTTLPPPPPPTTVVDPEPDPPPADEGGGGADGANGDAPP